MLFCPNCNNILDISKNAPKKTNKHISYETPTTISSTEETTPQSNYIHDIIQKLIDDDDDLTQNEIDDINDNIDEIMHNEKYINLDKATKKIIDEKLSKLNKNTEISIDAYFICKNCMFFKIIEPKTLITSRANDSLTNNYVNVDKFKNMAHSKITPATRGYICKNASCPSHKDKNLREAVFYRNGMQVWYTCKACQTYWKGE